MSSSAETIEEQTAALQLAKTVEDETKPDAMQCLLREAKV